MKRLILLALMLISICPVCSATTIAIFDISGSMSGTRIQQGKADCLALVAQSEIGPQTPFVLIPFTDVALAPIVCESRSSAEAAIRQLQTRGGTSLSSGLNAASQWIEQSGNQPLLVVLISDGLDSNEGALKSAEERLGRLLQQRDLAGLSTGMVIKRWGAAESPVVKRLQAFSKVIKDAGSAAIMTQIWQPTVTLKRRERSPDNRTLHGEIEASLEQALPLTSERYYVVVTRDQPGRPVTPLSAGGKVSVPTSWSIDAAAEAQGYLEEPIEIREDSAGRLVYETTLRVDLPDKQALGRLAVRLISARYTGWSDVRQKIVAGEAELEAEIHPESPELDGYETQMCVGGEQVQPMKDEAFFGKAVRVKAVFEHVWGEKLPQVQVVGGVDGERSLIADNPALVTLTGLKVPAAETTQVAVRITGCDPPVWTDVRRGLLATTVHAQVHVKGPCSGQAKLFWRSAQATRIALTPEQFGEGEQEMKISIEYLASHETIDFALTMTAPADDAIKMVLDNTQLSVVPPKVPRLRVACRDRRGRIVSGEEIHTTGVSADLWLLCGLEGPVTEKAAFQVGAFGVEVGGAPACELGPEGGAVSLHHGLSGNWFRQQRKTLAVMVRARDCTTNIEPAVIDVTLVRSSLLSVYVMQLTPFVAGPAFLLAIAIGVYRIFRGKKFMDEEVDRLPDIKAVSDPFDLAE